MFDKLRFSGSLIKLFTDFPPSLAFASVKVFIFTIHYSFVAVAKALIQ